MAAGLVQVLLATGRPVLRQGEVLLAEGSAVRSFRNVGDRDALVFRVVRDDVGPSNRAASQSVDVTRNLAP